MVITDRNYASLFMDGTAVFLLIGMLVHTAIYRRRKKTEDTLFFELIITNLTLALSDILVALSNDETFEGAKVMNLVGESLYYISLCAFAFFVVLYLQHRLHTDDAKTRKIAHIIMWPLIAVELMYIIGVPFGFFVAVDENNHYYFAKLYWIPVAIMALYSVAAWVLAVVYKIKCGKTKYLPLWIYLLPLSGLAIPYFLDIAALTPVALATCIAYMHMGVMNEKFFESEVDA